MDIENVKKQYEEHLVQLPIAGSPFATIVNQFENVRSLLRVEVWP
jgi:hypothetical protein